MMAKHGDVTIVGKKKRNKKDTDTIDLQNQCLFGVAMNLQDMIGTVF